MKRVVGFKKLEAIFKKSADLDLDKSKADQILDIVEKKFQDMLQVGAERCHKNERYIITEFDLPITKGFQDSIRKFQTLKEEIELKGVLEFIEKIPPLRHPVSPKLEPKLPDYIGALILILAQVLKEVGADKRPSTADIQRAKRILDLTL
ncbi:MAG: hypothetical protein C6I01_03615 [Epsilonproteobacteria bacterium]|jgi:hypothetical protein|nr:hypothetical protein [Campylobacterota bacterium]NPA88757.1 DUF1931 family protein [Campylobacterota bacterium]